ncbi:MAG TPA: NAD(P)-dependent oxidoreductase [Candidatus Babeliales bacterium]|nr:NAD(P)-dependent oxidoreductase [Candidatus Babeliales bacterium]
MKGKILVTDSLFIFDEHIKKLEAAGYEVERLDKPDASEDELCEAIKDKVAYVLGGVERATKKVIDSAPELKVISFPGIGYQWLIPAWQYAMQKGILIGNTPDAPTHAAAEWSMMAALAMQRGLFEIGRTGTKQFKTFQGIEKTKVGIYGLGRIGTEIIKLIKPFRPSDIIYYSTRKHPEIEKDLGIRFQPEDTVLSTVDILFICVPDAVGHNYFNDDRLSKLKNSALVVSISHLGIININDLDKALARGVRVANDDPWPELLDKYGPEKLYTNLGHNAFNTFPELKLASDEAVDSLINLLEKGQDKYLVNPEYKK